MFSCDLLIGVVAIRCVAPCSNVLRCVCCVVAMCRFEVWLNGALLCCVLLCSVAICVVLCRFLLCCVMFCCLVSCCVDCVVLCLDVTRRVVLRCGCLALCCDGMRCALRCLALCMARRILLCCVGSGGI